MLVRKILRQTRRANLPLSLQPFDGWTYPFNLQNSCTFIYLPILQKQCSFSSLTRRLQNLYIVKRSKIFHKRYSTAKCTLLETSQRPCECILRLFVSNGRLLNFVQPIRAYDSFGRYLGWWNKNSPMPVLPLAKTSMPSRNSAESILWADLLSTMLPQLSAVSAIVNLSWLSAFQWSSMNHIPE